MKNKIAVEVGIFFLIFIMGVLSWYRFIQPTFTSSYDLKGDFIPSINSVLLERRIVYNYKVSNKNGVLQKRYTYKNQDSVMADLKEYSNYLIQMEQFEVAKSFNLNDYSNTSIYLCKASHLDSNIILWVDIEYTADSYKIILEKKEGSCISLEE